MSKTRTSHIFYTGTGKRLIKQNKKHNINFIIVNSSCCESINDVFNCCIKIMFESTHNLCNLRVPITRMYEIFLGNSFFINSL